MVVSADNKVSENYVRVRISENHVYTAFCELLLD